LEVIISDEKYFKIQQSFYVPGTVKEQNIGVNINGNQIKLINAGKSLNLKGMVMSSQVKYFE
jgi:predicted nucleotidyltransferase